MRRVERLEKQKFHGKSKQSWKVHTQSVIRDWVKFQITNHLAYSFTIFLRLNVWVCSIETCALHSKSKYLRSKLLADLFALTKKGLFLLSIGDLIAFVLSTYLGFGTHFFHLEASLGAILSTPRINTVRLNWDFIYRNPLLHKLYLYIYPDWYKVYMFSIACKLKIGVCCVVGPLARC